MLEHYAANGLCDRGTGRLAFCAAGRAHGPLVIAAGRYFYRETAAEDDPSNRITNCGTVDCRQPRTGISIMTIVTNRVIIATWLQVATTSDILAAVKQFIRAVIVGSAFGDSHECREQQEHEDRARSQPPRTFKLCVYHNLPHRNRIDLREPSVQP